MNLGQLIESIVERTGFDDANFRPNWISFINESVREFGRRHPWPGLEDNYNDVLRSGQQYYIVPEYADDIVSILNTTDKTPIGRQTDFAGQAPSVYGAETTGTPLNYDHVGEVATTATPTGYLWVNSSDASDIETLFVTGLFENTSASGTALHYTQRVEEISANGASPVTLTTLFANIISISKATATDGDYFIYDAGNSDERIGFIPKDGTESSFRRLEFVFVPASDTNVRIRYRRRIMPLRQDAQSPPPGVRPDFIVDHAISIYQRQNEQYQKAQFHEQKASAVIQREANKEQNWGEPGSFIHPQVNVSNDPSDDHYNGG